MSEPKKEYSLLRKLLPDFTARPTTLTAAEDIVNYQRIWRAAVVGTLSVSLVPLILMAVWHSYLYYHAIKAEVLYPVNHLTSNAQLLTSLYLDERKNALEFVVSDNSLADLSDHQRLQQVFAHLKGSLGDIVDLGVITSAGEQISYVGPYDLQGVNYKDEPWFREVIIRNRYVSDVFLGFRDFPHIIIAIKKDLPDGDFFVLRTTLDTQKFNNLFASLNIRPSSDTFLINEAGVLQTPSRFQGNVLEKVPFEPPRATTTTEVREIHDGQGRDVIIGYVLIEDTPFTFVVVKTARELLRSWETFLAKIAAFLLVSIVIITAVIFRVSTLMVENIREADRKRIKVLHEIEQTAKMVSIGRLAAGVAHEINNPLAIINEKAGYLKDLLSSSDPSAADQYPGLVDSILTSVKRCSTITYRLLGFARHIDVTIEDIEFRVLMEEVLGFLGKEAEYRSIQVKVDIAPEVPRINSDRSQLQQVFLNVVNNAFAAVPDGGRVEITVRLEDGDKVSVTIADNGAGIPREDLSRIFEPFFSTKGRKGTGLGLSITYGIVKKLGGEIKVKSVVNEGTQFTVTLPVNRSEIPGGGG